MPPQQTTTFLKTEANAWFDRNAESMVANENKAKNDPVLKALENKAISPENILEIGCSNGWRLELLRNKYNCNCSGIEPSQKAVDNGKAAFPQINLSVGTADKLPYSDGEFDLLIFGFSLYLCDRSDLFKIACEADRVLSEKGHIVIYDFCPPSPYRNIYSHADGVYSYKMDNSKLFSWNPAYTVISNEIMPHPGAKDLSVIDDRVGVSILVKDSALAYPDSYKP